MAVDPAALAAMLQGGGGAPPDTGGGGGTDELSALQAVIQDLHTLITVLSDPQATQVASQCLAQLTRIQQQMMQSQQGTPQQAIGQRLQSGGGGY